MLLRQRQASLSDAFTVCSLKHGLQPENTSQKIRLNMLDFNFYIATPRLALSYLNPANERQCDFVHELNNSPEMLVVNKSLSSAFTDRETSRKFIEQGSASLAKIGYGRYLVSRKPEQLHQNDAHIPFSDIINTHDLIGIVSMQLARFPGAPTVPDVGFAILARYYGKGYATEAVQGLMKFYRVDKGHMAFAGYCDPGNESSKKMFRRLGFEDRGVKEIDGVVGEGVSFKCLVYTTGEIKELDGMRDVGV
jgi:RimJ/RimL family protein N-acetyltransferase